MNIKPWRERADCDWQAEIDELRAALKADLAAPQPEPDMRAICEALGFDPTNHHNAAKCPYCRPPEPQPVKQDQTVRPNIPDLLAEWERRSKDALPADAMLINKHIRELREAIEGVKP